MSMQLFDFLTDIPNVIIVTVATLLLLGAKRPRLFLTVQIGFMILWSFLITCVITTLPVALTSLTGIVAVYVLAFLFCKGKPARKLLYITLILIAEFAADYLTYAVMLLLFPDVPLVYGSVPIGTMAVARGIYLLLLIVLLGLLLTLAPSTLNEAKPGVMRKFALFPLSQVPLLILLYIYIIQYNSSPVAGSLGLVALAVCVAADAGLLLALRELNKKHDIERENTALQAQLAAQISYYDQLTAGLERINRIRHDFSNQIQTVYTLLESGDTASARGQIDSLADGLRHEAGPAFCENPVADAVLSDKAQLCAEKGVEFNVKAELPVQLPVEGVALCSVFANLLDNAVSACDGVEDGKERFIELSAGVRAGYLIVKVKNSMGDEGPGVTKKARETGAPLSERGLGLQILADTAERYKGRLETKAEDGVFEATIWLSLSGDEG